MADLFNKILISLNGFLNQAELKLPVKPKEGIDRIWDKLEQIAETYAPRLLFALITLLVGLWLIGILVRALNRLMKARDFDPTLRPFLKSILSIVFKVLLFIMVASMIGFETTSLVAVLGAAGLAIGLALQGSLSNFAGGVLILIFKPFRVGDIIEAQGHRGTVKEISVLYTSLITGDNTKVVIPNGVLSNNDVVNFTALDTRRVDLEIRVNYHNDMEIVLKLLKDIVGSHKLAMKDPPPTIGVDRLEDQAIVIACWVWTERINVQDVKMQLNMQIAAEFQKQGIQTPLTPVGLIDGKGKKLQ
jgi:small conductance mechanosensitive channel